VARGFGASGPAGLLVAVFVASAPSGGCASLSDSSAESYPAWDASAGGDGANLPGASADASSCRPGSVQTFQAVAYHPAGAFCGQCTPLQVSDYYADCLDPTTSSPDACNSFAKQSAAQGACAACIQTPDTAAAYGPLVTSGTLVRANVGGCIQLTDPRALACAKAKQAALACELLACQANCPVSSADPVSLQGYAACAAAADGAGCQAFAQAAECSAGDAGGDADGSASQVAICLATDFKTFYDEVVPLFCVGPPSCADGGSESAAVDGGAGDALADQASGAGPSEDGAAEAFPDAALRDADDNGAPAGHGDASIDAGSRDAGRPEATGDGAREATAEASADAREDEYASTEPREGGTAADSAVDRAEETIDAGDASAPQPAADTTSDANSAGLASQD